ncbi:MAG: hypothetical protein BroJett040_09200 [Oligoflexia bacterium]|nr:MAG: hypothetical protein BroJett040_09200 [Oligoflexia bacterium]
MFKLFFATPDKKVLADVELEEITLPAFRGELHILPGHAPLMTSLGAGVLKYKLKTGDSKRLVISWGYCQVSAEGVSVLAETAVAADEIDPKAVQDHLKESEERLMTETLTDEQLVKVMGDIDRLRAEAAFLSEKAQ